MENYENTAAFAGKREFDAAWNCLVDAGRDIEEFGGPEYQRVFRLFEDDMYPKTVMRFILRHVKRPRHAIQLTMPVASEDVLTMTEAAAYVKSRFRGTSDVDTIRRWCSSGLSGIQLESFKSGARRMTSKQAVERFMDRLSGATVIDGERADAVDRELVARGLK